ncbi:MAG: hypothetical protein LBC85_11000, partial [Fibromonadaceae bacterium]|nr:hypothetical protein [Fibromonadaceae bacterium]
YSIHIVYFELGVGEDYIYYGSTNFVGLHRRDELELSPRQKEMFLKSEVREIFPEYYILKVDRFRDIVKDKLDEWMYYLKHSAVRSGFDAPGLSAANELLEYSRLSRENKLRYDWYVDKWRSNVSSINTARDEGKAEGELIGEARGKAEGELIGEARGRAEGEARSRADIARKLKASGVPLDVIAQTTGLSSEEIAGL